LPPETLLSTGLKAFETSLATLLPLVVEDRALDEPLHQFVKAQHDQLWMLYDNLPVAP
jgi:hypothetical protein